MVDRALPLAGVRILDCSRVLAGPFATMLLADLGADVVKVEPPSGDESRGWGPPFWGDPAERMSAYFCCVNRNKRSIALDLRSEGGRQLLDRLAARSDLLVHNARPSSAQRLGLGAERLAARHPDLVVTAVGGFPGADAELPAYDLLAQAVSGLMAVTGEPEGRPMKVGVALLDLLAGLEAAVGAAAALFAQERTRARLGGGMLAERGTGRRVDVSLVEVGVTSLINVLANVLADGREAPRHGNAHPNIVPYEAFGVADGHVVIAVGNDDQFARLESALRLEPDPRFARNAGRLADREAVRSRIEEAVRTRRRDDVLAALAAADVPAGPVNAVTEALSFMERAHPEGWLQEAAGMRLAPDPIRVDGERLPLRLPPPGLGQQTDEILSEAGLTPAEVDSLRESGVVA